MPPILLATRNPAKFKRYQTILKAVSPLEVCSPRELGLHFSVEESGTTAAENAQLKARAFADAAGMPALGIDEALYIPALPPESQPGVMVRRSGGHPQTDESLLKSYLEISRGLSPADRAVRWLFALCLAVPGPGGTIYTAETGWSGWLLDAPVLPYQPGYPLSALLIDGETRKPVTQLTEAESRRREEPLYQAVARLVKEMGIG